MTPRRFRDMWIPGDRGCYGVLVLAYSIDGLGAGAGAGHVYEQGEWKFLASAEILNWN